VLATISDRRIAHSTNGTTIDFYLPETTTAQEYFAFGFAIPSRNYNLHQPYRYGFNGKENDNQVKLDFDSHGIPGAQQDYGERIYDPRVGRFLSTDPMKSSFSWNSPYAYAENDPISSIDLDGLEKVRATNNWLISGMQGVADGIKDFVKDTKSIFTKQTFQNVKNNSSDIVAAYTGKSGGVKKTSAFWTRFGLNLSTGISNTVQQPITFVMTIPQRTPSQNAYKIGYTGGYNFAPFALSEFGGEMLKGGSVLNEKFLFRFDTRSFGEIKAAGGFNSYGFDMNLLEHANGNTIFDRTSGFIPTARTFDAAKTFSNGRSGFIFKLEFQPNGLGVNKMLGIDSPFPNEKEIAVPLNIPSSAIIDTKKIGGK
jgi:RHS repeat-associated protein